MIYVILGMHKSGTTLVAQILHHSGINMGEDIDDQVTYDRGNKYERFSTREINKRILGYKDDGRFIDYQMPDELQITEEQRARMHSVVRHCNETYGDWGFKDPRTSLDYPLWASELPEHKIIAIYRPVSEMWPRFRYQRLHYLHKNPYRAWLLVNRWCEHNSNILTCLQNTKEEFLVLSFRQLMASDAEFRRLEAFVGVKLNDQRQKGLYRGHSKKYLSLELATWLVRRRTGCSPERIVEQFEALRRGQ